MYRINVLRRLALAGTLLAFCVVVFGAYVRLTDAGLGCPDWPGCYGHLTPSGAAAAASVTAAETGAAQAPIHVGKAWREMIHRYGASTLGLIIVVLAGLSLWWRRQHGVPRGLPLLLVALVIFQGLLGMWTVLHKVNPLTVTLHLVFGLTTLSVLWWLWVSLRRLGNSPWAGVPAGGGSAAALLRPASAAVRRVALIGLIALALQIMLGGWTSSNYAATACPDFPRCQAAWWPQADFRDAFVPWRGLGVNYEGGVLAPASRVAIHFTHRLGAIVATLALLFAALSAWRVRSDTHGRWAAGMVLLTLALQLTIGISMVLKGFPLWLATAHNAGAALLLLSTLALNRALRRI
jgi:cytochrome c oxidase assembly protein subunit 15